MTPEEIQKKAEEAVGNWTRTSNFIWDLKEQPHDSENWTIFHIRVRDSEPLERANARAVEREFEPFAATRDPDAKILRFNHWACGWVDAVAIRVYGKRGKLTEAFLKLCELEDQLEDYPVLDEDLLLEEEMAEEDCYAEG